MPEPQGGVAGHGTLASADLADSIRRRVYLPGECRRAYAELRQLVPQYLSRMNDVLQHS